MRACRRTAVRSINMHRYSHGAVRVSSRSLHCSRYLVYLVYNMSVHPINTVKHCCSYCMPGACFVYLLSPRAVCYSLSPSCLLRGIDTQAAYRITSSYHTWYRALHLFDTLPLSSLIYLVGDTINIHSSFTIHIGCTTVSYRSRQACHNKVTH